MSYVPVSSSPPSDDTSAQSPALDSFTELLARPRQKRVLIPYTPTHFQNRALWEALLSPGSAASLKSSLRPPPTYYYPSIIPTNANFFNYILLLALSGPDYRGIMPPIKLLPDGRVLPHITTTTTVGDCGSTPLPPASPLETPLTLAWMRTLGVQPSTSTLAVSLVLWGEVCARVDGHGGGGDGGDGAKLGEEQYLALVAYLRDWVGERRVPHWRTLEKWRGLVGRMRGVAASAGFSGEEGGEET